MCNPGLIQLKSLEDLRVIDQVSDAKITDDGEILDFMVRNRVSALWQELLGGDGEAVVAGIRAVDGGSYVRAVRDAFLREYEAAMALPLPAGYSFCQPPGELVQPNPMQRLTAHKLLTDKRVGNWSGVGTGKTNAAILSAGVLGAKLTVVLAANATLEGWEDAILKVFPDSAVHVKDPFAFTLRPGRRNFLVLNYESFQQTWSERFVREFTAREVIDLLVLVLDEVQFARQRKALASGRSQRRELIEALIAEAVTRNPDLRILGMSATPVVNNLREAVKLLELIVPERDFSEVPVGASVANAVGVHLQLRRHGIRHRPPYPQAIETTTPHLDGSDLLAKLVGVSPRDVLRMEQVLLETKLNHLDRWLRRGTLIYTHYVQDIVEPLTERVERAGYRVRHFTGRSRIEIKEFLDDFRANRADVLIGSAPVGTGVDGLQFHLNRLVFITLPWSNAEYQQIVGRLYRQGSAFEKVEVIIPQVVLREEKAGLWSWDDLRLRCIEYKRTLADAALDGVIPLGGLPSREEMQRRSLDAVRVWVARIEKGIQ